MLAESERDLQDIEETPRRPTALPIFSLLRVVVRRNADIPKLK